MIDAVSTTPSHPASSTPDMATNPPVNPEPALSSTSKPVPVRKPRIKAKSRRPRRRVETSDPESDDGGASDDSLTSHSDEPSDDEEDEDAVEDAIDHPSPEPGKSFFADVSSTTPAAWAAEEVKGEVVEMSFEEFNRGERGKARGRGGAPVKKREYTEEETRRFEERKARLKEKQKAKRAELKEARKREKKLASGVAKDSADGVVEKPVNSVVKAPIEEKEQGNSESSVKLDKGKPKKGKTPSVSSTIASTSALTIDEKPASRRDSDLPSRPQTASSTPAPPTPVPRSDLTLDPPLPDDTMAMPMRRPRVDNREAYAQRVANDVKFTPRVGNFWTHDQRHYDSGAIGEGGYAGLRSFGEYWRGPRGGRGFRGGSRGRGQGFPPASRPNGFRREPTIEPNSGPRLEMDKVEAELEWTKPSVQEIEPEAVPQAPRWGHEAFESVKATEQFQANRMATRGRGRGRGFRGSSLAAPFTRPLPTPETTSDARPPSPPAAVVSENLSTQPAADALLAEPSKAVTVKLPGSSAILTTSFVPRTPNGAAVPQTPILTTSFAPRTPNGAAVLQTLPAPPDQPVAKQPISPGSIPNGIHPPPQFVSVTGSENGSISSASHLAQPTQILPAGTGLTQNGDYYNGSSGSPNDFHPARPFYPPRYPNQQFFPSQSYSPDPYASSPQAAFFPNGYPDTRAGSPFANPYAQAPLRGYFTPPRPTAKVSIRAPPTNGAEEPSKPAEYPSVQPQTQYGTQHYNPYVANGMGMQAPEGIYFDGSGYVYQQYGEVPAGYVYEGEYPGY